MSNKELQILNGRIMHNDNYKYDFHQFRDVSILVVYCLLPGIISESLVIRVKGTQLSLSATIKKQFRSIFRKETIILKGRLKAKVNSKFVNVQYIDGILIVKLAIIE